MGVEAVIMVLVSLPAEATALSRSAGKPSQSALLNLSMHNVLNNKTNLALFVCRVFIGEHMMYSSQFQGNGLMMNFSKIL